MLVIGIEDNGVVTGIDEYPENVNEILRVPFDFCRPSIRVETDVAECIDQNGRLNHLLIITIPQSTKLQANQQDDVYYRMGDKSQKLSFDDRLRLMYSKGTRYYEDEPVADSTIDDIDMDVVAAYCEKIGYTKSAQEYITQNKSFIVSKGGHSEMSGAAILLFGKDPQRFFQRARIRFIRYEGMEAKVGAEMNVIKDRVFTGRILDMLEAALSFVQDQIKEHTHLDQGGKFVTTPEYRDVAFMLHVTVRNGAEAVNGANSGTNGKNGTNSGANEKHTAALAENELIIYQYIKEHAEAATNMIAEETGLPLRTTQRYVSMLKEKGYIDNEGTRKQVKWVILK